MEESEPEEGEACSYHENRGGEDYDSSVDPDVALSYIDEKIQDVLGHFQKDFEGGISAENLGAKFGGYGSFLPAYQRSLSNSMSPSKVQEDYAPRPSKTIQIERAKHLAAFRSAISMPSTKDLMSKVPSICTEEFDSRCESARLSNRKMKKLQLKARPDNVSTQKRAAIYSGLGLDVSPSSSLDESLSGSEGMLHEHQDAPFESPTFILQIMTSFPVPGGVLLSPLPDNQLKLAKMENAQEDSRCVVTSSLGERGSNYLKDVRKVSSRKKVTSLEKNDNSAASLSGKTKGSWNNNAVLGSKESEISTACQEMASRTIQLPLLSNVDTTVDDMTRSSSDALHKSSEGNDGIMREKGVGDLMEEETLNHKLTHNCSGIEKAEVHPEFLEDREVPATNCLAQGKDCYKGQEKYVIKTSSQTQYCLDMPLTKEKISCGGKEKSKASQSQVKLATDVSEGSLSGLSSNARNLKSIQGGESNSETELGEFKADRNSHNSDRYKDLFGDMDIEEDQNRKVMQGSEIVKKSMFVPSSELRERLKGNINGKLSAIEAHLDAAPEAVPGSDLPMLGKAFAAGAHSSEEDKWVCCDKCQKCRLLPPGTNPENLPDKWLCSMLDWLPSGMNKCSVCQEETTSAVRAMCQATTANVQSHVKGDPGLSNFVSGSPHDDEMIHSPQMLPGEVNKRCPAEVSDSVKKSRQISAKTRSLNDVKDSSLEGEDDLQQLSKSSHGRAAIQATKEKVPKDSSEEVIVSKKRFRREHDRYRSKSSKKARNTGINYGDEDWTSERDVLIMRTGNNSDSTVLTDLHKERQKCHNEASLKISACDTAGKSDYMIGHSSRKAPASMDDEIVEARAPDGGDFVSKRIKMKESRSYPASLSSVPSGWHRREKGVLVTENECKEAKVGVVNSKEKESSATRGNRRIDEESGQIKQSNNDLASTGLPSTQRGLRLTQPPVAAACSSSKASGSLKSKASFHDMRGSPAESVSSSPRRSLKPDNLTLARQTISEKHDFDAAAAVIPVGGACSNGKVVGRIDKCRSDTKVETAAAAPNGSLESSILDPDRDNFSGNSEKAKVAPSPDISNLPPLHYGEDSFGDGSQHPTRPVDSDKCSAEEIKNEERCGGRSLNIKESEKLSSSRSKDKKWKSQPEGMENSKLFLLFKDRQDCGTDNEGKPRDVSSNQEITSVEGEDVEGKRVSEKDSAGRPCWNSKRKSLSNPRDARCSEHAISSPDCNDCEFSLKKITSGKANQVEISSETEKPLALHAISTYHKEMTRDASKLVPKSQSTDCVENLPASRSSGDDALKMPRQIKKSDHQNGDQRKSSHHFTSNGHRLRDVNAPVRRDSTSHAVVNALKEAKDLKHLADRLKNGVSNGERIVLYFQAALKFLHGAALLESSNSENSKRGDMVQSIQIYGSTAKLCEFCAREYEKSKDLASAALAYKCMEVAYLKVVYSSHNNASKDREELQTTLKIPPGESPSASDVDNVNNTANLEKVGQSKAASSPQVAGSQTVATKRPNFNRLLDFAQNVSSAMEASRKSRSAFSAASTSSSDPKFNEAILSIKTALDYNFQDVEGLLRLVRLATEAISR